MLTHENRIERLFCPVCGKDAYDCTGESDYICTDDACNASRFDRPWVAPLRERDLQGRELIRLRLENEQLRAAIQELQRQLNHSSSPETSR